MPLTFVSRPTQLHLICSRSLLKYPWCPCRRAAGVTLQALEKPRQTWTWTSRKQQTTLTSMWGQQLGASTFCRRKCLTTITHLLFLMLLSGSDLASLDALLHGGSSPSFATKAKNLMQLWISRWNRNLPFLARSPKLSVISFSQPNMHRFCLHLLSTAVGSGSKSTDLLLEQLYLVTQILHEHTSLQTKQSPSPAQGSVKTLGISYSLRHGELPPLSTKLSELRPPTFWLVAPVSIWDHILSYITFAKNECTVSAEFCNLSLHLLKCVFTNCTSLIGSQLETRAQSTLLSGRVDSTC